MTRAPRLFERTNSSARSREPERRRHAPDATCTVILLAALCAACGGGIPQLIEAPELTEKNRELYARTNLEHARALHREGRLEHAESRTRRGLGYQPDHVQLIRTRAGILEDMGRGEEAAKLRARADQLDPPAATLPATAHPQFAGGAPPTVLLLPPSPALRRSTRSASRVPQTWPDGEEAEALSQRVSTRLPGARVLVIDEDDHPAESVAAAGAFLDREAPNGALSIRIDRAYCGSSVKDGSFAVAWLRVAAAVPGAAASDSPAPHIVRATVEHPPREGCKAVAIGRAFEQALATDDLRAALAAGGVERSSYTAAATRSMFPLLAWRVGEQVDKGRRYLAVGELMRAQEHFERAVEIDPDDPAATGFLDEVTRSLAVARLLEPGGATGALDPQLSSAQRTGMEAQLEYETKRREEMLSALAVLYETRSAPTPGTVANMRPFEVRDPSAIGIALAMPRIAEGSAIEVKTLFAPDGTVLARYYFSEDSKTPVLREDDTGGDGVPDRWVGYEDGLIREVWESDGGTPTLHIVYQKGGSAIERIEFDHNGTGEVDRVFVYAAGVLQDEAWDTNGDGSFDRFQQFDESGSLTMREEDVDGDDEIDIRTAYNNGRIVRREILNSELLTELQ